MPLTLRRIVANPVLIVLSLVMALPAQAQVLLSFHSFNGSMMGGRYPHTFIVMEGTLEADGTPVNENYGYTSVRVTPAILSGDVDGTIHIEKPEIHPPHQPPLHRADQRRAVSRHRGRSAVMARCGPGL